MKRRGGDSNKKRKIEGTDSEKRIADVNEVKRGVVMRTSSEEEMKSLSLSKVILKLRPSHSLMKLIVRRRDSYERSKLIWIDGIKWRRSISRVHEMRRS